MKRIVIYLLPLLLFVSLTSKAQVSIQMEKDGGVYKVPCKVNGAPMKFIFDTGAATVCLSAAMAEYLLDNDFISPNDFIGKGSSIVADGRIVDHLVINLRDIEIAGLHLKDVESTVIVGQKGSLLLGQTAIQQLGRVLIDGDKLIIDRASKMNDKQYIDQLSSKASTAYYREDYLGAIQAFEELRSLSALSLSGYDNLTDCLFTLREYERIISIYSEYENLNDPDWYRQAKMSGKLGLAYSNVSKYYNAISSFNKAIGITRDNIMADNWRDYSSFLMSLYRDCAFTYVLLDNDRYAQQMFSEAIQCRMDYLDVTTDSIKKGKVKDYDLGDLYYNYALTFDPEDAVQKTFFEMAVKCGSEDARHFVEVVGIHF